jgi:NAD(P)-dependent dehydrogenase (short-subunit alcohol dehydrogenase family)
MTSASLQDWFGLNDRVAIVTGGAGLLGPRHAEAIARAGGYPVIADVDEGRAHAAAADLSTRLGVEIGAVQVDVSDPGSVARMTARVLDERGRIDILVNNAARNPKVESRDTAWSRFETFALEAWNGDIAVGLTGAFLCAQAVGRVMAERGSGVIVNIASDLAVIAPDQRLYREPDRSDEQQPVKPVSYSVVKTGLVGLTRYLATYWADRGVRVNALSPGGIFNGQPDEFVRRVSELIPLGRMARVDEYEGALLFLCSDASSYLTGFNLVIDGGRSVW